MNLLALDMIVGSGGVLSHAPRRAQSALMMLDAYQPEGVTLLTVDSIFMMPQLGILSTVHPRAATDVFERDCLIYLGTCIAPIGVAKEGDPCVTIEFNGVVENIPFGDAARVSAGGAASRRAEAREASRLHLTRVVPPKWLSRRQSSSIWARGRARPFGGACRAAWSA